MPVVHCKHDEYDVYIGRGSKWGNPFVIGTHGNRRRVLELYEEWFIHQYDLVMALPELYGKTLGCWCKPSDCHGDILERLANEYCRTESTTLSRWT